MLVAGAGAFAAYPEFWQRFADLWQNGPNKESADSRLEIWRGNLIVFQHHPIFGVGPGRSPACQALAVDLPDVANKSPHNVFMTCLSEMGLPGLLFYTTFYLRHELTGSAWRLTRFRFAKVRPRRRSTRRLGQAKLLTALVAYLGGRLLRFAWAGLELPYLCFAESAGAWSRVDAADRATRTRRNHHEVLLAVSAQLKWRPFAGP